MCAAQAKWNETDAHVCQLPCKCPADGGRCTLGATCLAEHFACKQGYTRFSDRQLKCFKQGCPEASLQARHLYALSYSPLETRGILIAISLV